MDQANGEDGLGTPAIFPILQMLDRVMSVGGSGRPPHATKCGLR
jgi:hypothetical protein